MGSVFWSRCAKSHVLLLLAGTTILASLAGCPDPGPSATDTYGCSNTCDSYYNQAEARNGICEDGGPGSVDLEYGYGCYLGTDCADCGPRTSGYYVTTGTVDGEAVERAELSSWGVRFR